ncbi:hypothetical protein ACPV4B_06460 [Vibrio parahaemolyticus]|uniref:hypothetical protein n=1 Tax=Vibrio mediterranei TaxID=689 RepID=UPI004067956D
MQFIDALLYDFTYHDRFSAGYFRLIAIDFHQEKTYEHEHDARPNKPAQRISLEKDTIDEH